MPETPKPRPPGSQVSPNPQHRSKGKPTPTTAGKKYRVRDKADADGSFKTWGEDLTYSEAWKLKEQVVTSRKSKTARVEEMPEDEAPMPIAHVLNPSAIGDPDQTPGVQIPKSLAGYMVSTGHVTVVTSEQLANDPLYRTYTPTSEDGAVWRTPTITVTSDDGIIHTIPNNTSINSRKHEPTHTCWCHPFDTYRPDGLFHSFRHVERMAHVEPRSGAFVPRPPDSFISAFNSGAGADPELEALRQRAVAAAAPIAKGAQAKHDHKKVVMKDPPKPPPSPLSDELLEDIPDIAEIPEEMLESGDVQSIIAEVGGGPGDDDKDRAAQQAKQDLADSIASALVAYGSAISSDKHPDTWPPWDELGPFEQAAWRYYAANGGPAPALTRTMRKVGASMLTPTTEEQP